MDGRGFPLPLVRFLQCVGIEPKICPPHQPQKNPYVERYHRNFKYECEAREQPTDLESTIAIHTPYVQFYNHERPNQAVTCGNQPPLMKFPHALNLTPVPETVDPDRWILQQTGKVYTRKLGRDGCFQLGNQTYYVQKALRGRRVAIRVDGYQRELGIFLDGKVIKKLPIKGLQNRRMAFDEFVEFMAREAASAWQRYVRRTPRYARVTIP